LQFNGNKFEIKKMVTMMDYSSNLIITSLHKDLLKFTKKYFITIYKAFPSTNI